jgi:hypothetical protein
MYTFKQETQKRIYLFRYTNWRTVANTMDMKSIGFEDSVLRKIFLLKKKV